MKNKYLAPLMMPFLLVSLFGCAEKPSSSTSSGDVSSTQSPTSNSTTPIVSTPVISSPVDPIPQDPKIPYGMDQFLGATASDTIKNMIGTGTYASQNGKHWYNHQGYVTTSLEQMTTVKSLQDRINAGIDSLRVVGSPVMAYSPRTKTNETPLDKKLHGVIDANGNVTELPQYASWQWALKFTKAGVNDVGSYFELVAFIGGPASSNNGGVTEINKNWPATISESGTRTVIATQAIRNLGLTGTTGEEWAHESANLITRGGYIQDYQHHGIDPVSVIMPGYIEVANGDTLYTGTTAGSSASDYDLTTPIFVGKGANEVKAGKYPVKRGIPYATAGSYGACGKNQFYSTLNQIWAPGYVEFGQGNAQSLYNLRSLTYLGGSSFTEDNWAQNLGYNYEKKLASLYYNASDPALKAAFNAGAYLKTDNQSLIDKPTGLTAPELPYNSVF